MATGSRDGVEPKRSRPATHAATRREPTRTRRELRPKQSGGTPAAVSQTRLHNQQLAALVERVSDALVAFDKNWRYTYVNPRAAELLGRPPGDLLGRHFWTEFPHTIGQPFQLACEKALADQVFMQVENRYTPAGRWFDNRIYPSPDGVAILFYDVTDRRQAEQAARDNAALLEAQNQVLESIARGEPIERTLDMLLRFIESQCPEMLCSILLPEGDDADRVRHAAAPSLPAAFTQALQGDVSDGCAAAFARAALRPDTVIVDDIGTSTLWDDCRSEALAHGLRACWSSPILDVAGAVLGTFAVFFRQPTRPSDRHRYLIDVATSTAASALLSHRETEGRRVSEERLRMAVTGGNVGIWEWDVMRDRFALSDQLRAMFDWPIPKSDLTLNEIMARIHRDDRPRVEQAFEQSVAFGVDFDVEYRVVGPAGSFRWIATKAGGEYHESSTPVRMMGIALDITNRKEAELQLRRSEERFQHVARATNDAIWDWDLTTGTVWWNQGINTLFGYSEEEIGSEAGERATRIHPDDLDAVRSGIASVTARGEQFWSGEFRFRRPDGSYADVFDRGFVTYDASGIPVRMIGAMTDISDRKRALEVLERAVTTRTAELNAKNSELEVEIAERKRVGELLRSRNEELKAFAYTVSHDLKAPLRGIAGYAQELDRRHSASLDQRALLCIDRILTATRNLDRLIEDLLHYSRLDGETPTPIEVNLARVIDGILRDRRSLIAEQHADIGISLTVNTLGVWERGLTQVLTNLIDNALKYSKHATPPRVQISSMPVADGVRFSVSDNGIGFDMKYHDRMFGLFNRLVRQEDFEGTGAGLAIVKKLVEKMRGAVWAESSPGAGATFIVELPLVATGGV